MKPFGVHRSGLIPSSMQQTLPKSCADGHCNELVGMFLWLQHVVDHALGASCISSFSSSSVKHCKHIETGAEWKTAGKHTTTPSTGRARHTQHGPVHRARSALRLVTARELAPSAARRLSMSSVDPGVVRAWRFGRCGVKPPGRRPNRCLEVWFFCIRSVRRILLSLSFPQYDS